RNNPGHRPDQDLEHLAVEKIVRCRSFHPMPLFAPCDPAFARLLVLRFHVNSAFFFERIARITGRCQEFSCLDQASNRPKIRTSEIPGRPTAWPSVSRPNSRRTASPK